MKMINKPFEMFVLGPLVSNRIKKKYQSLTYKQETEETQLVKSCLDKLITANHLEKYTS